MKKFKSNQGITLLALVITIIVIIILASISVYEGREIIKKSKVQTLETNMLTIEAKAKAYAEEIEAKIWNKSGGEKDSARNTKFSEKHMNVVSDVGQGVDKVSNDIKSDYLAYEVTNQALTDMGLEEVDTEENEKYIVIFSKENYKLMDVIYYTGVTYKGETYYTLSDLKDVLENE